MPTISSIEVSALRACTTLVPTLPVAPVTATLVANVHRPGSDAALRS
jgi:hypothetical protein